MARSAITLRAGGHHAEVRPVWLGARFSVDGQPWHWRPWLRWACRDAIRALKPWEGTG